MFLENGYEVVCLSRKKPDLNVHHIPTDLTDEASIMHAVETIQSKYPDFCCFINCAAVGHIEKLLEISPKKSKEMFDVNVIGPSLLISALLPSIKNNVADSIYIGATIAYKANEFMPIYSVTKWGLRGLIENVRQEVKSTKCRVIAISPGGLDTPSNIGPTGRETTVAAMTGKQVGVFIKADDLANFVYQTFITPKNMEISEVIINRK